MDRNALVPSILLASVPKEKTIKILDLTTQVVYQTFAETTSNGLTALSGTGSTEGLGGAGDYIISSQLTKQSLVVHRWGKTQPIFKCPTPEQIGPIASTPDGLYVIAGGKSGKLYVWEVASGSLIQSWDAHFKAVSCLVITPDGGHVITASEDTIIRVWAIADVVAEELDESGSGPKPIRSWSEHSLPVTGLYCGHGGLCSRIISSSLDHTAKIYELYSDGVICSVRCPSGLSTVTMDAGEKRLILGGTIGDIYMVEMDVVAMARTANRALVHTVGGGGGGGGGSSLGSKEQRGGSRDGGGAAEAERLNKLVGHSKAITSLCCTWDGQLIVSASEDGTIRTWDIDSQQCIKKVSFDTPGPINQLLLLPRPAALLDMQRSKITSLPLQPFKKYKTSSSSSTDAATAAAGVGVPSVVSSGLNLNSKSIGPPAGETLFILGSGSSGDDKEEEVAMRRRIGMMIAATGGGDGVSRNGVVVNGAVAWEENDGEEGEEDEEQEGESLAAMSSNSSNVDATKKPHPLDPQGQQQQQPPSKKARKMEEEERGGGGGADKKVDKKKKKNHKGKSGGGEGS